MFINKVLKRQKAGYKFYFLVMILMLLPLMLTGCDTMEILRQYEIEIAITSMDEGDIDQLQVKVGDRSVEDFAYEGGVAKADIGDLRGSNEIKPVLAENDEQDFYPESVTVGAADDGETINFNAVQEINVFENLQVKIDEAYPGDILILDNADFERAEISTPGLILKSSYDIDETDPEGYTYVAGLEINENDVTVEEINVSPGSSVEINDCNNIQLINNRITGNNNLTGIQINNSEVFLEDNTIRDKSTGIVAEAGSELYLRNEIIRDNRKTGLKLSESSAEVHDSEFRDNEQGFDLAGGSDMYLVESELGYQERGIYIHESSLEVLETDFYRNDTAVVSEDASGFELRHSRIDNSSDTGIKVTGGSVKISHTDLISNGQAMNLNEADSIEISDSTINNNTSGLNLDGASRDIQLLYNDISYNNNYGIKLQNISGELKGNKITNNRNGIIHRQGGSLQVENNDIADNRFNGLEVESASAEVIFNNIIYNDYDGGRFIGEKSIKESRVNENNIIDNGTGLYASWNYAQDVEELNAEKNWWGNENVEMIENMTHGPVRYEPILEEEQEVGP